MKTLVYCHGYGSNRNTDKVDRLKKLLPDWRVLSFDADLDPEVALEQVGDSVTFALADDFSCTGKLVFVGTSLGGWLANALADKFGAPALLVNPAYDPKSTLPALGADPAVVAKYTPLDVSYTKNKKFVFSSNDEVLDHSKLQHLLDDYSLYDNTSHRFNGPEFEQAVTEFVNSL